MGGRAEQYKRYSGVVHMKSSGGRIARLRLPIGGLLAICRHVHMRGRTIHVRMDLALRDAGEQQAEERHAEQQPCTPRVWELVSEIVEQCEHEK